MLEELRDKETISELRRRECIAASMCYGCFNGFFEASKRRLAGDTARAVGPSGRGAKMLISE